MKPVAVTRRLVLIRMPDSMPATDKRMVQCYQTMPLVGPGSRRGTATPISTLKEHLHLGEPGRSPGSHPRPDQIAES